MSLSDHLPSDGVQIDARRIVTILWLGGIAFLAAYLSLVLLSRLGLPVEMAMTIISVGMLVVALACGWFGRTMTSRNFFFSNRSTGVAPSGFSGCTDWLSGGFLGMLLVMGAGDRLVLAPSAMIGMLLCTVLFATAFQRSKVSTVPGFLTKRYERRRVGLVALVFVSIILGLLLITEVRLASHMISKLAVLETYQALVLVVVMIALPTLIGGWLALVIMNAILVVWVLICVLIPATVTGFFPDLLVNAISIQDAVNPIDNLALAGLFGTEGFGLSSNSLLQTALAVLVLSCGFACLPHALSRLTLSFHHVTVLESLGWSALSGFLILSAFPLSIGLLAVGANTSELSQTLSQQPILQMLPALALLLAALNAASATVFALSSAIVRLMRRTRNLDPGERTMFGTRALCVILCFALAYFLQEYSPPIGLTFMAAISISAAALFAPLTVAVWASRISSWAIAAAIALGGSITTLLIAAPYFTSLGWGGDNFLSQLPIMSPISAAGWGMLVSVTALAAGRGFALMTHSHDDQKIDDLRLLSKES